MQRAYGLDIPATLSDLCDPRHMAVLIYDMQAGIVSQISFNAMVIVLTLGMATSS